ncbi:hypothetical protein DICSQDRAFT_144577 [Dichomitus squalens LYAD-421 SS1]|uniref:uncharacterized protein n=1 Tax=Dichomitus squalens (strain LYAD-421) TaxID=732165 RepID=UPI00044107A4|nr:uncharacterized protein DICSQDRAFT_144577 [Dichomitus squalens LYAD-421 SS1]EJF64852.1 hypothetical protein DICSQDRAFT_144577 [Dichomitus squalens LYAD-421 SS1]
MFLQTATKTVARRAGPLRVAYYTTSQTSPRTPYPSITIDYRIRSHRPLPLRTLYHGRFQQEDYLDLSDSRGVLADARDDEASPSTSHDGLNFPYINYWRKVWRHEEPKRREIAYFPFPVNTRGFLYFHQHRYPVASGLRFRIAQTPDLNGHLRGQDLLTPYGTPWHIPLIALATSPRYTSIVQVLQQDGYVPPQLYDCCVGLAESVANSTLGAFSQLLFRTWQPFYLDLANPTHKIFLVTQKGIGHIYANQIFSGEVYPFKSGVLLCQFENRRGRDTKGYLALRVLRIVEPVHYAERYNGNFEPPQTGQCIKFNGLEHAFLSKKPPRQRESVASRLLQMGKTGGKWAYAWSWNDLKTVAGPKWKYPWENRRKPDNRSPASAPAGSASS